MHDESVPNQHVSADDKLQMPSHAGIAQHIVAGVCMGLTIHKLHGMSTTAGDSVPTCWRMLMR